ncbi:MAG: response regulator [Pyrinomonadaceae bacterium]|nr:response regulator [Pyrinomonadaceae bacterium]
MSAPYTVSKENHTLLIVDADEEARARLQHSFEQEGYLVVGASEAPTALRLLHIESCDLIVLDTQLPEIDGLALCRLLRAQALTKRLPIIITSAVANEERKVEAFAAGADDFVAKPFAPQEMLSRVSIQLEAAGREEQLVGSNIELGFLADLGRGLLHALEPLQVARRVAGATFEGTEASLCAAIVKSAASSGEHVCVFDREGVAEGENLLHGNRLREWLSAAPSNAARMEDREHFFLQDEAHKLEYAAPLRFGGVTLGALVVAFDRAEDFSEAQARLVDAAAQLAALSAHISTLYETARLSSQNLAKEVELRTAEVEAQRRFTEAIIDSLPLSLYAIDRDYQIVAWNRNRELGGLGVPRGAALGRNIFDVLTKQPRETLEAEFARVFQTGKLERIEQGTHAPDGTTKHWMISKIPMHAGDGGEDVTHVITVGEDVTERVETSNHMARAEKLAAVGRLAAGVVHEINNPLATISACAESLQSRVEEGTFDNSSDVDNLREYLALIHSEAFRCKSITNGLLDFSRVRAGQFAPVDLSSLLESAARLVKHQGRGERVKIEVETDEDLPLVSGDVSQLQQAVIALATNAIDAMSEGGTLTFRAHNENSDVLIEISDTGAGIAPEHLTRIFDPFFTTKEVGQGTGLGLAVCYGIVTEHGGTLGVESAMGRGSTFMIRLPAVTKDGERRI